LRNHNEKNIRIENSVSSPVQLTVNSASPPPLNQSHIGNESARSSISMHDGFLMQNTNNNHNGNHDTAMDDYNIDIMSDEQEEEGGGEDAMVKSMVSEYEEAEKLSHLQDNKKK